MGPSLGGSTGPANPLLQGGQQLVWLRAVLALDHLLPAEADDVTQGLGCIGMLLGKGNKSGCTAGQWSVRFQRQEQPPCRHWDTLH